MTSQIILVRHGETAWSVTGRHTGNTDLPLTVRGEERATELRALLQPIAAVRVLTSPLRRARRTCELAGLGDGAQVEPEVREWDYGDFEGRTTADIRAQHPGWNVFQDGCPQGESAPHISARADRVVAGLRGIEGTVVVFSHAHFLRVLAVRWIGLPIAAARHLVLDTGSLSVLGYERPDRETPSISLWNADSIPGTLPAAGK